MLNDTAIRHAKPNEKPYKLYDGDGLYLLTPTRQGAGGASSTPRGLGETAIARRLPRRRVEASPSQAR